MGSKRNGLGSSKMKGFCENVENERKKDKNLVAREIV